MKRVIQGTLASAVLVASFFVSGASSAAEPQKAPVAPEAKAPAPAAAPAPGGNYLLLNEMMQLNKAYRDIISAVALEDSKGIVDAIERFESSQTVQMTQDAFKAGKIQTPKNPDRMKEFERMDKDFHRNLEKLRDYAKANNKPRIRTTVKKVLDYCIKCHERFRK